jgi:hypothetical protein
MKHRTMRTATSFRYMFQGAFVKAFADIERRSIRPGWLRLPSGAEQQWLEAYPDSAFV